MHEFTESKKRLGDIKPISNTPRPPAPKGSGRTIEESILVYCEEEETGEFTKKLIKLVKKACGWPDEERP